MTISGRILLDGADLRDYNIGDLQSQISVIFQDFIRYEMTAPENIALGRIGAVKNGAVYQAARKSMADQVIKKLLKNYEQLLGLRFEGGVDLSGGEWQKIAHVPIFGMPSQSFSTNRQPVWMHAPRRRSSIGSRT